MAEYRLYLLDGRGRIMRAIEFSCEDDETALQEADRRRSGQPAELWQLGRFVRSLKDA
jgi:hypothetical protein